MLWGVAEDHSSNPIKIGLDKLKRHGAKFVSINPVRTGYSAIADEWVPIRPAPTACSRSRSSTCCSTDGTIDFAFLARYTNAPWLVIAGAGHAGRRTVRARRRGHAAGLRRGDAGARRAASRPDIRPALFGDVRRCPTAAAPRRCCRSPPSAISTRATRRRPSAERCGVPPTTITPARARNGARRVQGDDRAADPHGPTCGAARTTRSSAGRSRCTRCAASPRTRTASRPAARCT